MKNFIVKNRGIENPFMEIQVNRKGDVDVLLHNCDNSDIIVGLAKIISVLEKEVGNYLLSGIMIALDAMDMEKGNMENGKI